MYGEHVRRRLDPRSARQLDVGAWLAAHGFASVVAVAILTYFHIVIGEMLPKSLALQSAGADRALAHAADAVDPDADLPVRGRRSTASATSSCGRSGSTSRSTARISTYTSEELQLIVEESEEQGALRSESGQVLQELFEFGELTAGEVMVPRVRITGIPVGAGADELREILGHGSADALSDLRRGPRSHRRHVPHQGSAPAAAERPACHGGRRAARAGRPGDGAPRRGAGDDATRARAVRRRDRRARRHVRRRHARGSVRGSGRRDRRQPGAPFRPAARRRRAGCACPGTIRLDELGQLFDLELAHEDVDSVSGLILTVLGTAAERRRHRPLRSARADGHRRQGPRRRRDGGHPTWIRGRRRGLASVWRSTSRVTGAVSPSPKARNFSR